MYKYIICIYLIIFFIACNEDFDFQNEEPSKLVVEGWIEAGGFPVVILTRSLPISSHYQQIGDFSEYVLRWAKVTVSDGIDSVVLTGKYDKGYFPPYIYTTGRMRGVVGKRYSLTVEYKGFYASATTTIPSVPDKCSFKVERCEDSDTLFQINARFHDNPIEKNYYQFFTRVGSINKQFLASYLGSINDEVLNEITEFPVYQGHHFDIEKYIPYYTIHDTVSVKFAQVDETSFRIWDSYIKTLSLSGNMFLSTSTDMVTNIIGGYGYWCGYGALTNHIIIQDSIKENIVR